ncbi:MAG: glycine zipper 2TM domain-containing protein [Acidobacteria bacterium]|nr:glycine zipper 2TM domain-containing protein [Acidobacteriota bacterium]
MARRLQTTGAGSIGTPGKGRSTVKSLKYAIVAALVASTVTLQPVTALAQGRDRRDRQEDRRDRDRYDDDRAVPRGWRSYDYRRYEPGQRRYDAARYYRNDRRYRPYRLGRNDRIYRGSDNRYYCRRDDGTTGLIVGGMAGGILGSIIAPGGSKTLGAIIGAGAGALIGREIDNGLECR